MYDLKRHKTKVSVPCRLLIRSFRDFHNINLCFVCCLFKQINLTMCNKNFLKAKKKKKTMAKTGKDREALNHHTLLVGCKEVQAL